MSRQTHFRWLAAIAVVVAVLVLATGLSAQGPGNAGFERAKEVQERHTEKLMAREGVVGTAVGLNNRNQQAILVLLERPGIGGIPQALEGVPVHPVVTGTIYALKPPTGGTNPAARFPRPVPTGVSTGHPDITAGTIGCRVAKGGQVYALSNNHVYANENRAKIGDNALQPGPFDGGINPDDAIGTLAEFEPIKFGGPDNTVDAAIALSSTANLGKSTPAGGYGTPKSTTATAVIGMQVQKYGRTTKLTSGKVYALNATVNIQYSTGVAKFVGQIVITPGPFSAGGDSGSLIVTKSRSANENAKPVGLLFAGSSAYTIANPIGPVLSRFGVVIDDQ